MTGSFLDVDTPNTNWRAGSEDPIPVLFGRLPVLGFVYRFATCRPLDGTARTDATFWRAGTKCFTRSGHTAPYQYWPGWKRGLLLTRVPAFGLLPYTGAVWATEKLDISDPWWMDPIGPTLAWLPLAGYGAFKGVRYVRNYRHERQVLAPIRRAAWATLRTRDGIYVDIPPGMVHGRDRLAVGTIGLPTEHALHDNDRDNLLTAVRERLGHHALDARWNMEGAAPHVELWTPPQPPDRVTWDTMLAHWDSETPYLGQSAHGPVSWDLGEDSPHIGIGGGSGSGKSELMAWIVAQFMRAGAGVVVLDPKYVSHRWLSQVPRALYCREPAMVHDTVLWLDMELRRRGGVAVADGDAAFPRIVVLLEERNSLQTLLREHWAATRPRGAPNRSPALAALDRLASQGRAFNINVILAAQEVTKADIGSRNNFGAFALAGRLPVGAWRLVMGPGAKKPAMSIKPGRFGYAVAGHATVFQGAYPDLKRHAARLIEWATQGEQMLDVRTLMQQHEGIPFTSPQPVTAGDDDTPVYITLRDYAQVQYPDDDMAAQRLVLRLRTARDRDAEFPRPVGEGAQNAKLYREQDLDEWMEPAA
jgi:hypothetical protein